MSRGERMRRVDSLVHQVVADRVAALKDPRLGFVTVTGVETSPDLRTAVVWISVLGDESDKKGAMKALAGAATKVTTEMGREIKMRYTPRLEFRLDESLERGTRIISMLTDIEGDEE